MNVWMRISISLLIFVTGMPVVHARDLESQSPPVRRLDGLQVIELEGKPYEIGFRHGQALAPAVEAMVDRVLAYVRSRSHVPLFNALLTRWKLKRAWRRDEPFIPEQYLEELRGLSDGSGVSLGRLYRLHAQPDRTYTGAGFAAWDQATAGGRLVQMRNLDWTLKASVQDYATVFVVRPDSGLAFVNIGWAGFIGALSGINAERIAIGQIGAESIDVNDEGRPMVFLLREILQRADDLDKAEEIVCAASRKGGVNYLFSDAYTGKGIVIETTHRHARIFQDNAPAERTSGYGRPLPATVFRADTAMDPVIRDLQLASRGDPERPGLEPPAGRAYEVRYLGMAEGLRAQYGRIDADNAKDIAREVAPDANVQSVVYAWPEVWVANAEGDIPAAHTAYRRLDVRELLQAD